MTTCGDIKKLLGKTEFENIKVELKSSKIFENLDWKDSIAKELVAFANLQGGKLVIGIQDDGKFDGKLNKDIDKLKGDIDNIIRSKISPTISYGIEFLNCAEGDLIIITVEKKTEIPFAYIVSREGPEIKNRIYYIRTPHGRRLVSDGQLKFLFNEEKLNILHQFSVVLVFKKPENEIPDSVELPSSIMFDFSDLYNRFYFKYKDIFKKKSVEFDQFVVELLNYQMIYTILKNFQYTWDIEYLEPLSSKLMSFFRETPKEAAEISNFPEPHKNSELSKLSIGVDDLFGDVFIRKFHLPPNTKIEINQRGSFKIYNDIFNFSIGLTSYQGGQGIDQNHPHVGKYRSRKLVGSLKLNEDYSYMKISFIYEGSLKFPGPDIEYFDSYIRFINAIKDIIDTDWNYDVFVKTLPNFMFYNLEERLNRIENMLKKNLE
jgi:hypothetical protein